MVPSPEIMPIGNPMQDKLAEAWNTVKGDPGAANISRELDAVGVCALPILIFLDNLIVACR
jgi:hypothetical protein